MKTLRIREVAHLCHQLRICPREVRYLCATAERHYYYQTRTTPKGKVRQLATPVGRMRVVLDRLNRLLQRIELPENVHGGRRGRSYETNAKPHHRCHSLLKADLADFFPHIGHRRVYEVFARDLQCSPDVARVLTRLVTVKGGVPQGSPTSAMVAVLVARRLARRVERMAKVRGAASTIYIDDISVSGPDTSRIAPRLCEVVEQEGFEVQSTKTRVFTGPGERVVTGVRVDHGPDVPSAKLQQLRSAIATIAQDAERGAVDTSSVRRVEGLLQYVERLNRGAAKSYRRRLKRALRTRK